MRQRKLPRNYHFVLHQGLFVGLTAGLIWLLAACVAQTPAADRTNPIELAVFAAASVTDGFTAIGSQFKQEAPGVEIIFNFAGSQQLAQQLAQGAPADLFASANSRQLDVAIAAGRIVSGTAQIFAHNELVLIIPQDNPAQIETLQDLAKPGLKLVLAAAEVPVGQYALTFLAQASADARFDVGYQERVLANVVSYEQNVRAVLTKVMLGEADAGLVYRSDVDEAARKTVQIITIPAELNVVAAYPIAVVSNSAQPLVAQQFMDFLLSPAGQEILARYGFLR